jgi:hypothetical protein
MTRPLPLASGVSAALGLLTVAWPLAWAPAWAYPVAVGGAAAVLAGALAGWEHGPALAGALAGWEHGPALAGALAGWRRHGPALAVAAAIAAAAFSRAGTPVLAAEGLFILAYLITADAPPGLSRPADWLRHQVRLGVAGLIASGAVLAALALHRPNAAWLALAGLSAAVAAYLIALPRRRA